MRIAYLGNISPSNQNQGVQKKITNQIQVWSILGHEVRLFNLHTSTSSSRHPYISELASRFQTNQNLISDVHAFNPDIIYFRFDLYSRTTQSLLSKHPYVIEVNSIARNEILSRIKNHKSLGSVLNLLIHDILTIKLFKNAKALISVTHEIQEHYLALQEPKNRSHSFVSPNSIPLNEYPTLKSDQPKPSNSNLQLFFLGSPNQDWHGVDWIYEIAKQIPEFHFHIIGAANHPFAPKDSALPQNVTIYAKMNISEYQSILKKMDIAIGTLALYRANLKEGCPLKVREYLANGFPCILGYSDTALMEEDKAPEWVLQIDLSKGLHPEIIDHIKKFSIQNRNRVVLHSEVAKLIDSSALETRKMNFIQQSIQPL